MFAATMMNNILNFIKSRSLRVFGEAFLRQLFADFEVSPR